MPVARYKIVSFLYNNQRYRTFSTSTFTLDTTDVTPSEPLTIGSATDPSELPKTWSCLIHDNLAAWVYNHSRIWAALFILASWTENYPSSEMNQVTYQEMPVHSSYTRWDWSWRMKIVTTSWLKYQTNASKTVSKAMAVWIAQRIRYLGCWFLFWMMIFDM
jgi:hypothetical protein